MVRATRSRRQPWHAGLVRSVLGVALFACTACSTFVEHRAALVPHSVPVDTIGQPNQSRVNASLGASNIADLQRPGVGNPDAGVAIPSRQFRGQLALGITKNLTLGWIHERGLASSAQPVKDTLPPLDDTTAVGNGPVVSYSIDTGSPWRIGLSAELIGWSIPYVEYSTCIDFCPEGPTTIITRDTAPIMQLGIGIVPSYRFGGWTFFGGLTGRSHPTIEEKVISNGFSADVEEGPFNAILHGGVAYDANERVRFKLEMHQTVTQAPVAYGPGIGFALEVGIGPMIPKDPPPTETVAPAAVVGPPGSAPLRRPPTMTEVDAARTLATEAQAAARAGECERTKAIVARINELDETTYIAVMQDRLVSYCVAP